MTIKIIEKNDGEPEMLNEADHNLSDSLRGIVPKGRAFTTGERFEAAIVSQEAADEIERLRAENSRLLCLMTKAHAVMRQTGWQLAPASAGTGGDGVLELAAAEVESEVGALLMQKTTDGGAA